MMYKTYQEARINCPEACVCLDKTSGMFFVMPSREGTTLSEDCEFAEAKDHCMTVKEFLDAGYRFVEGDLIFSTTCSDRVVLVTNEKADRATYSVSMANAESPSDNERYVLRAAALDKKPRTKVEYVKVEGEGGWHVWEFLKAYSEVGDECWFYKVGEEKYAPVIEWFDVAQGLRQGKVFYRRIETPMTEREAFIDFATSILSSENGSVTIGEHEAIRSLFDSGKFKLVD